MDVVHEVSCSRELRNVWITEQFQPRVGELRAQGGQHGQRENEVADRATADHENLVLQGRHYRDASPEICMAREGSGDAAFASMERKTVSPSRMTNTPKATRAPVNSRMRCSLAVIQFARSRSRHGETVSHIPTLTQT